MGRGGAGGGGKRGHIRFACAVGYLLRNKSRMIC